MENDRKKYIIGLIISIIALLVFVYLFINERSTRINAETEYEDQADTLEECNAKMQSLSEEFADLTREMKDSIMNLQGQIAHLPDSTELSQMTDEECLEAYQFYKARSDQMYKELLDDQRRLSAYVLIKGYIPQDSIDAIVTKENIPDSYDLYRMISDSLNTVNRGQ